MAEEVVEQQGTSIRETSVVDTPQDQAPVATVQAEADLLTEYVAAGEVGWMPWHETRYIRKLPNPSDELMSDFGSKLYDVDMQLDPQVYSTLSILVMAVLAQGTRLSPPVDKGHPDYEASLVIMRLCDHCQRNLGHSLPEVQYELVDGMLKMGHKVGELVFARRRVNNGIDPAMKRSVLSDIKTKPQESTAFVVDGFNNVLGLLYKEPGKPMPTLGSIDPALPEDKRPKIIPRHKFVIPTHKPRNGDPRGTSHLRSVYAPWWKKQMWNPQHLAYVTRFAQPSMYANLPENSKDIPILNADNTPSGRMQSITKATTAALAQMKGGAVASFINTTVEMLQATSEGKVIFDSYAQEDRQIAKGLLMQTLTTEEGQHMARAASAIHQDVFGLLIAFVRSILEWSWRHEVLKMVVRVNFGEDAADSLVPKVSLGDTEVQDIPKLMAAYAQLEVAGAIHWSQRPAYRVQLNIPPANDVEEAKDRESQKKMQESALANAKVAAKESITNPPAEEDEGDPAPKPAQKPPGKGAPKKEG